MNLTQVEENLQKLVKNFSKEEFIFDLLLAYGLPKNTITLLRKGNRNLSKCEDQIILKKNLFFQSELTADLHATIDTLRNDKDTYKHNPRFILITDYKALVALDTKTQETLDIEIAELPKHAAFFMPWAGQEKYQVTIENPADVKAAYSMAKLYDEILKANPIAKDDAEKSQQQIHELNIFLSRLLFCFFAEDTDIFPKNLFTDSLSSHTQSDGNDLDGYLNKLFEILNTPPSKASLHNIGTMFESLNNNLRDDYPEHLTKFPYVNGGLFGDKYYAPKFSRVSRKILIEAGNLQWKDINPDIFGSMIQAVVHPDQRSGMGMHYTSVPNIMKVIEPLLLNELREEFENNRDNPLKLKKLLERLYKLKIFDPACGSGNFLIIAYKELRKLEMDIFKQLQTTSKEWAGEKSTIMSGIRLSQFYGIELDDFAHEVAILSLWLAEHQMNVRLKDLFGSSLPSLPLREGGNVICANATRKDWEEVCPKTKDAEIYILGNPPYLGSTMQGKEQKTDMGIVFAGISSYKNLDYIACWFMKASEYIKNEKAQFAFVSTNSICQGEQVGLLWPHIINKGLEISFAHTSFKWINNAKANAGVICLIVGLRNISSARKKIFRDGVSAEVKNINPYITTGENIIISKKPRPISKIKIMENGNKAVDGGYLLFQTLQEKEQFINQYPQAIKFIREITGSKEFIQGTKRWCLWISEENKSEALEIEGIRKRISAVHEVRLKSTDIGANKMAETPYKFRDQRMGEKSSLIIPSVSSERRDYIPIGYLDASIVIIAPNFAIFDAPLYLFGVVSSKMHMTWVKATAGRLKTDFRYSSSLCYNTFPFPEITEKQKEDIVQNVYNVLAARENYSEKNLAQLYDPKKMPTELKEAHHNLDYAIERCYRSKPFTSEEERLEYLFKLYEEMVAKEKPEKKYA